MAFLTCELYSQSLRMPTTVTMILPQDITLNSDPPPTLYLLHGCSHNHSVWHRYTSLERYCQSLHVAVIMPEANRSFYTDMNFGGSYLTYISQELPALCESMFRIHTDASRRYIAGMSMGGYGSLKAALSRPSFYKGCATISAVTDIKKHVTETPESQPKKREFRGIFGPDLQIQPKDDLYDLAARSSKKGTIPDLYFCCGTEDHLYQEGKDFLNFLTSQEIPFSYEEWPGIHDWNFWDRAIEKVLRRFFE